MTCPISVNRLITEWMTKCLNPGKDSEILFSFSHVSEMALGFHITLNLMGLNNASPLIKTTK
jgi:hypothetical protein